MKIFNNLSLSRKLALLIVLFLAALVLVGTLGITQLRRVSASQSEMYSGTVVPLRVVVDGGRQAAVHFRRMYPYVLKTDSKSRDETRGLNEKTQEAVEKAVDYLLVGAPTPELRQLGAKLKDTWGEYLASSQKLRSIADAGDGDGAMQELKTTTDPLHVKVRDLLVEAGKQQEAYAKDSADSVVRLVDRTANWILAVIAVAAVLGASFGWLMTRTVLAQLGGEPADAVRAAGTIAGGDLRSSFRVPAADRSSLLYQLSRMRQQLSDLINQVRQSAELVASAAGEISAGTNDLSMRTEQQASALEETAASMEQLGSASSQNSDNARVANQLSTEASSVALQAGAVVSEVVETMKGINESSSQISDIIGVIDGIAFQTNILALNAAVEAARAGEQGRGFAVVASEVRALAQRSADAAKQIKTLISASSERVERGTALVDKTGASMTNVVASIRRVSDIVAEISAASIEQSSGVRQVSDAVQQLDHATQQNAALVEESAAASESLRTQAAQLVEAVRVFHLD